MECDKVKELLPFLDDDSLETDVAEAVRTHLKQCECCSSEYHEQVDMLRRFRKVFARSTPEYFPEFLRGVQSKIRREKENRILYRMVFSTAAIVIIVIGATLYSLLSVTKDLPVSGRFALEESTADFDNYVVSQYLDLYELSELLDKSYEPEEYDLFETYFSSYYFDITPEDIIETLDDDELTMMFTSY